MSEPQNEAELVALFLSDLAEQHRHLPANSEHRWTAYQEACGWDIVMVNGLGIQLGIEAKMSLNAKVIDQALQASMNCYDRNGPDFRAVLVPSGKVQHHLGRICTAIGLGLITVRTDEDRGRPWYQLPGDNPEYSQRWVHWYPEEQLKLPEYIPDVEAGKKSPVSLTQWKIRAIKLHIVLERRGYVTRADMRLIGISPTRWTCSHHGYLDRGPHKGQFVANGRTPDLKAQHPRNYAEIEADFAVWSAVLEDKI